MQVARERVLGRDGDGLELEVEVARVDAPRAIAEERAERAGQERAQLDVPERRERADRVDAGTHAAAPPRAARRRGGDAPASGARNARLGSRRHDGHAARLASVGGDLADDLRRPDAERAGQARRPADGGLNGRRDRACASEVRRDRAEVEVALVDSRALDARDDLADRVPDDARVLTVERVPRAEEDGVRAASTAPRPRSSPSGFRTSSPRSSRSTPRRGRAGLRRRRAACRAATGPRAPRRRRRTRRGRGGRGSSPGQSYCWLVIATPALPPPAIEQPAPRQVSYGLVTGRAARGHDAGARPREREAPRVEARSTAAASRSA